MSHDAGLSFSNKLENELTDKHVCAPEFIKSTGPGFEIFEADRPFGLTLSPEVTNASRTYCSKIVEQENIDVTHSGHRHTDAIFNAPITKLCDFNNGCTDNTEFMQPPCDEDPRSRQSISSVNTAALKNTDGAMSNIESERCSNITAANCPSREKSSCQMS